MSDEEERGVGRKVKFVFNYTQPQTPKHVLLVIIPNINCNSLSFRPNFKLLEC
jgi:hypothetical protein